MGGKRSREIWNEMSNILFLRNVIIVRIGDKVYRCIIVYEIGVICEV